MKTKKESPTKNTRNTPKYEIGRALGICAATGREIGPNEHYIATLREIPEQQPDGSTRNILKRFDYSLDSWESIARPAHLVFYWKAKMHEASDEAQPFVDDEVLLNLFDRLEDDEEPTRRSYRFVLGLILMRKKLLRCIRTERKINENGETESVWQMRKKGTPPDTPEIPMIDPKLKNEEVHELADQLGTIFREDFE